VSEPVARPPGCFACGNVDIPELPVRERIIQTAHWRLVHAFNTSWPGWLVLLPTVHATALAELEPPAAAELGPLLRDVSAALAEIVGCVKTYVVLFAEAEGFGHLHFHVIPRPAGLPHELQGPRVFQMLGLPPDQCVAEAEMDRIGAAVRELLPTSAR
jgi:diadenosine tetraphosphate (Ap4A) HIT family hydrolase